MIIFLIIFTFISGNIIGGLGWIVLQKYLMKNDDYFYNSMMVYYKDRNNINYL